MEKIDLKKEHQASLDRPRYKYSLIAKLFFFMMDILVGKKTTFAKILLTTIPYILLSHLLAVLNIRRAFLFNAEFEDHAEHVYAEFVRENPELEKQPVNSKLLKKYGQFDSWADVFRRISLDERDHMNNSFIFCGKPEFAAKYKGMPN